MFPLVIRHKGCYIYPTFVIDELSRGTDLMHAITLNTKRLMGLAFAAVAAVAVLLMLVQSDAGAATACTSAAFTDSSGNFDMEGYLACLTGSLPSAGSSNNLQIAGIALGALVVGGGLVLASVRNRRTAA